MNTRVILLIVICVAVLAAAILIIVGARGGLDSLFGEPEVDMSRRAQPEEAPPRPAFDASKFQTRCFTVAAKSDTEPKVLEADRRICACLGRMLKPEEFAMLLDFTEADQHGPDAERLRAVQFARYHMSEPQFMTEVQRIQAKGRDCLAPH